MQYQALPNDYQTLRSEEKLSLLWDHHIVPTTYAVLPPIKFTSIFRKFYKLLHPSYLAVSFNHVSDELPKRRERLIHPNGAVAGSEMVPVYQIIFAPNHQLDIPPDTHKYFRTELCAIPKDSVLYTISIRRTKNGDPQKIGTLVSRSAFVSSAYGDEKLFFQHYRK